MDLVYIRFDDRADEAKGIEELALNSQIIAYRGGVYAVRQRDLKWLKASNVPYRLVTETEVEESGSPSRRSN